MEKKRPVYRFRIHDEKNGRHLADVYAESMPEAVFEAQRFFAPLLKNGVTVTRDSKPRAKGVFRAPRVKMFS